MIIIPVQFNYLGTDYRASFHKAHKYTHSTGIEYQANYLLIDETITPDLKITNRVYEFDPNTKTIEVPIIENGEGILVTTIENAIIEGCNRLNIPLE